MFYRGLARRGVFTGACAVAALSVTAPPAAAAKESKRSVCTAAYSAFKSAVERERAGHLREARDLLSTCMQATACGGLVPKCAARYDLVMSRMPSIVPVVTDPSGSAVFDVQVKMDGEVLTSKLDGKGVPVEAGGHELTFATSSGVFASKKVLVVEGERNRRVEAFLGGPPKPEKPEKTESERLVAVQPAVAAPAGDETVAEKGEAEAASAAEHTTTTGSTAWALPKSSLPYVVGIIGLGGVVAGGFLTYWGNKDNDVAKAQCNHMCPQSAADHIQSMYIAADVSFAAGAVGLGVATWLIASSRSTETKPQPAKSAYGIDLKPIRSGGSVVLSGAF